MTWQAEQQSALDMPAALPSTVTLVALTAVISALLLVVGRSLRLATDRLAALIARIGPISRWISGRQPSRVHRAIAWIRLAVAVGMIAVVAVALQAGMAWLISSDDVKNADATGRQPTNLGINSGSPGSGTPWETLGREGRFYVSNTMTPAAITEITGQPEQTPVRVYVDMQQGQTPQDRTALALQELDRVDAWSREYLVIFGATGTGWSTRTPSTPWRP